MIKKSTAMFFVLLASFFTHLQAQQNYAGEIKVLASPTGGTVKLRWAPTTHLAWNLGNTHGYDIVRYVFDRQGEKLLKDSVRLTQEPLKPLPLPQWETLAKNNRYAAITAQALYGASFQLNEGSAGQAALINKNTEQQNRFSFALASADQSLEVAKASGLYYEDKSAEAGTEYVYYLKLASQKPGHAVRRGSVITNPGAIAQLPPPDSLYAEFGDRSVRLHWNTFFHRTTYNYYIIERSTDGRLFKKQNELNFLQLIPEEGRKDYTLYFMDSLAHNDVPYYYRVKGITAFGEEGPPSNVIKGEAHKQLNAMPGIKKATIDEKGMASLFWYFPDSLQAHLKGFYVARGFTSKGPFKNINQKILSPTVYRYTDRDPNATNYYVIRAESKHGQIVESMPMLVQVIDSMPSAAPTGLTGVIDSAGVVTLLWNRNTEADVEGYKIFRSYYKDGEYVLAHDAIVTDTSFLEKVQIENLTKDYYYKVAAVDHRSNTSAFSVPLLVKKPDLVPPSAPVLLKPTYKNGSVLVKWIPGTDSDLSGFRLYRANEDTLVLLTFETSDQENDEENFYKDDDAMPGIQYRYKLIAVDDSGLASDTAEHSISVPESSLLPLVKKITYAVDSERRLLKLNWQYESEAIDGYILYRSLNEETLRMIGRIPADQKEYVERNYKVGQIYKYRLQAYKDGNRSELSEWIRPSTN